jgi:hypothetical protein
MAKDSEIEDEIDELCKEFGSEMTESNQKTKKSTTQESITSTKAVSKTPLTPEDRELRRLALIRLKERYSSSPSFANRDEAWWRAFQNSRAMAGG